MLTASHPLRFVDPEVLRRSRHIGRVLAGHGLQSILDWSGLARFAPRHDADGSAPASQPERLRRALGELGVTFIKLGQTLSTRADLLPAPYIAELSKLQDAAPAVAEADVRRQIAESLGAPPEELFAEFDPRPLASASIGQVHAARLASGEAVVVKVMRPGVVEESERDLAILGGIVDWIQVHTPLGRDLELRPLVDEFAYTLRNELDYLREGQNLDRFRTHFANDPSVWIPRVHWELTRPRVLTMERVSGIKISDLAALDALGVPRRRVAENALRIFLSEVLDLGWFHADPHPGNFFVQPDGSLAILDFGMVGRLSESVQLHVLRAGLAARRQDVEMLAEELYALGVAGRRADRAGFQRDLDHLIGRYGSLSIGELSAAAVTADLLSVAHRHKLQLPPELALLLRVVSMSEGVGLSLDPDFHYLEYASPFFRRALRKRQSWRAGARRFSRSALEAAELGAELPRRVGRLLGRLERGELQMNVHHEGLEAFSNSLQRMANRLALAVILAASVVALAVALGVRARAPSPQVDWLFGLGFFFSLAFGLVLLWSMWRARGR